MCLLYNYRVSDMARCCCMSLHFRITQFLLHRVTLLCHVFSGVTDGFAKIQRAVNMWFGARAKFRVVLVQTAALTLSLWN